MLVEPAKPHDIKGMCRAINRLSGGKMEQKASELDSAVASAVNSIIDSAVASLESTLSNATSDVRSGLDSAVSDLESKITIVSDQASANSNALSAVSNIAETNSDILSLVSNQASANSVAIASVESTLSSVIASVETELSNATSEVKASAISELASTAKVLSDATSEVKASAVSELTSAISNLQSSLSNATSEVKASAVSELASTAKVLSDATSAVQSGVDSVETIASDAYSLASDTRSLVDANEVLLDYFNGIFIETIDFTVSEAAGTVTGSLERDGGGDLNQRFSDGYTILDCTPAKTINLTAYVGTDVVPKKVFVYILQSDKNTLVASNSDWPTVEHAKIANLLLRSAATTGTDGGALVNRNWNDHTQDDSSQGHITDIVERIRQEPTQYHSGVALTLKDGGGAALTTGNSSTVVELVTTVGKVYQLHKHTFPAIDMYTTATDKAHITNQPTNEGGAYETTVDLVTDITHYIDGTAAGVAIGVNKYFNLVIWGVQNRTGEYTPLMCNLPTGQYNNEAGAISDTEGTSVYNIPNAFKGEGFLIARLTFRLIAGAQWTYIAQEDLRGQFPVSVAGVGVTTTDHALLAGLANDDHTQYALDSALVSATEVLSDATSVVQSGVDSVETIASDAYSLASQAESIASTHKADDGSDHSFIDQDVKSNASPTFDGIVIADGGTIGQSAGPLLTFNDTDNYLGIMGCDVGIGTVTPLEKLHLEGAGAALRIKNTANATRPAFYLVHVDNDRAGFFYYDKNYFDADLRGNLRIFLDNAGKFIIDNASNICFGVIVSTSSLLTLEGTVSLKERAAANGDTASYGQLWVKNTIPCELWFTDDTGVDHQVAYI